jgi:hypothetical protein
MISHNSHSGLGANSVSGARVRRHRAERMEVDGELPEFHMDWTFPGEEHGNKTLTVMVVKMRDTKMTMSSVAPTKATGEFITQRIITSLRECGCEFDNIVLKADQEPAIDAAMTEVARMRAKIGAGRTIMENSPTHSSKSNGIVERGIQGVQGQVRVMRSALVGRWGVKLDYKPSVLAWMVERASYLTNMMEVGHDGKRPTKGKAT